MFLNTLQDQIHLETSRCFAQCPSFRNMGPGISAPSGQPKEMCACCPEFQKCLGYAGYCLSSELTPMAVVICPMTNKSNIEETILHDILPDRVCCVLRNAFFKDTSKSQ